MLVLTRSVGESIRVTGPCTFEIVSVIQGKVRIALEGPRETVIVRTELDQRPPKPKTEDLHDD